MKREHYTCGRPHTISGFVLNRLQKTPQYERHTLSWWSSYYAASGQAFSRQLGDNSSSLTELLWRREKILKGCLRNGERVRLKLLDQQISQLQRRCY